MNGSLKFSLGKIAVTLLAAITMAVGGAQLVAAQSPSLQLDCGNGNWCALSKGGQQNCTDCCRLSDYGDGLCGSFEEDSQIPPIQYCICI